MSNHFPDLQTFLAYLERQGELKRVQVEVNPELEVTEIATRVVREKGPALLFERVRGADFPLAMNIFGSERRIEMALGRHPAEIGEMLVKLVEGVNPPSLGRLWGQRAGLRQMMNFRVSGFRGQAASQEVVEEPRLDRMPILKTWPGDGGRFVTYPLVMTTHPQTGGRNVGIYRMHVYDERTTGMHWQIQKGGRFHYWQAEQTGKPFEVAVVLGGDPALMLSAAIALPENIDEVAFSGLLRGKPAAFTRAKSLSMRVPANAEFVLEGVVPPVERHLEGPFGDHFGYYSKEGMFPVFHIRKVTRRRNAVYPATVVGKPPQEDKYIGDATQEMVGPLVRLIRPEVVKLWAHYEAGFHNLLTVAVKVRYRREAIKTGLALLGESQLSLTKCVILVDSHVDPKDFNAVLEAIRLNFDPATDLTIIPRAPLDTLDFSSFRRHLGSKMIIDATAPVEEDLSEPSNRSYASYAPDLPDLARLDPRIREWRLVGGTLLAVKVSSGGREVCEKVVKVDLPRSVKLVATQSEDVDLSDQTELIWSVFTRFDPARDICFRHAELRGAWPVYEGPVGIDATFKDGYPDPLVMPEEIVRQVSARWGEYFRES